MIMKSLSMRVHVSAFEISRYPITNAQYRAFIEDGGYTGKWEQCWTKEGWQWREKNNITEPGWVGGTFDLPNHPVVGVSWYEAVAFCAWLTRALTPTPLPEGEGLLLPSPSGRGAGGEGLIRLPTEAEWEYAARGPENRKFPWKEAEITPDHANYGDTSLSATNAVGCFPRGRAWCGAEEMAGNVREWCQDWFQSEYYAESPERDPQGPDSGEDLGGDPSRVGRGGSWGRSARYVRCAYRYFYWPRRRGGGLGFRPVRIYH